MSKAWNKILKAQDEFNKRYGVDFSIEELDGSTSGLDEFSGSADTNANAGTEADEVYRATFTSLYKKAYGNFVDRKLSGDFDFVRMINEFENEIMVPYREQCQKGKNAIPKPFGGWKVSKYLESVGNYLGIIPAFKAQYAETRYREGELSVTDMRKYVNNLRKKDNVSPGELSTVDCYVSALSTFNKNRSIVSIILSPIQYISELISIRSFTSFLEDKTGGPLSVDGDAVNEKYMEISEISADNLITKSRVLVESARKSAEQTELAREDKANSKEKLTINDAKTNDADVNKGEKVEIVEVTAKNLLSFD